MRTQIDLARYKHQFPVEPTHPNRAPLQINKQVSQARLNLSNMRQHSKTLLGKLVESTTEMKVQSQRARMNITIQQHAYNA